MSFGIQPKLLEQRVVFDVSWRRRGGNDERKWLAPAGDQYLLTLRHGAQGVTGAVLQLFRGHSSHSYFKIALALINGQVAAMVGRAGPR